MKPAMKTSPETSEQTAATPSLNAPQYVYYFGDGSADGNASMRAELGGKGANLADMCALGLPVPPGFTITTDVCTGYFANAKTLPDGLRAQVASGIAKIEKAAEHRFGDAKNPLLVSVRSGSRASMPGMMDTILNLGLNDETVAGLIKKTGNTRFAYDSYRRFIQMYANVVLNIGHHYFEDLLDMMKNERDISQDTELSPDDLIELVEQYKQLVERETSQPFPQDVHAQLWGAVQAVFDSWMNPRAITYRKLNDIPESWGTAVNVQAMVFGNMGDDSATGVAFTRNPSTGEKVFFGEFLLNAQGEDVVAGIRTPQPLNIAGKNAGDTGKTSMQEIMPKVYDELVEIYQKLETHYRDMQDIEFTVENHKLWMLQTRNGKRTAKASLKIAIDMVAEKLIDKQEALMRIDPHCLDQLLHPTLDPNAKKQVVARGLPASPGAASGKVVFNAEDAETSAKIGEDVILVRIETSPEDIHGMHAARGILTARGGMTSHAAVVARGMGKCCVSGAGDIRINYERKEFSASGLTVREGEIITLNGATGEVMLGKIATVEPDLSDEFNTIMQWADDAKRMAVRTNAETVMDANVAKKFGAQGIGLCRTEHMFFDAERITAMREMIVAETTAAREAALAKILPMQTDDFVALFKVMDGLPVTIRLLDPPLHEFLPHSEEEMADIAKAANLPMDAIRFRAKQLQESNPMMGHRGCRLGITYPEIYAMQLRAIFTAAKKTRDAGISVKPEIMIPLIMAARELQVLKTLALDVAKEVLGDEAEHFDYMIGTMIELPRAALRAAEIAKEAEFFSFGTNDLTQMTLGISRDDAASFIEPYRSLGILEYDPFMTLDIEGVGELVQHAVTRGKSTRADIKLGICGEHGGDPASIHFCESVGLDYVSCSPYRVPIARLAAAQASIKAKQPA
jgi:pyruvate,orthophosphate dikinase